MIIQIQPIAIHESKKKKKTIYVKHAPIDRNP